MENNSSPEVDIFIKKIESSTPIETVEKISQNISDQNLPIQNKSPMESKIFSFARSALKIFVPLLFILFLSLPLWAILSLAEHVVCLSVSVTNPPIYCPIFHILLMVPLIFPLTGLIVIFLLNIYLFYFIRAKIGLKKTVIIFFILYFLFYLVAPGNLGYLLYRAITLNP